MRRLLLATFLCGIAQGAFAAAPTCTERSVPEVMRGGANAPTIEVYGTVQSIAGKTFMLATRSGGVMNVDASPALADDRATAFTQGLPVVVVATRGPNGALLAQSVARAKPLPKAWANDCFEPEK